MTTTAQPAHIYPRGHNPMPPELGILFTDDVARILTEEARAAAGRRIVAKKLQPAVTAAADWLPSELLGGPVDKAIAELRRGLTRWTARQIDIGGGEPAVEAVVADLRTRLDEYGERFRELDGRNPHVKAGRRAIESLRELLDREWDQRRQVTVSRASVWDSLQKSYPKTPGGSARYADKPMPAPQASLDREVERGLQDARGRVRGEQRLWYASQEPDLRAWYRSRPGPGVGGGRPAHKKNLTSEK